MDDYKQYPSCASAREIDMVDYLANAGYHPQRIRHWDYWYLSPLRTEKTASFKINRRLNRWYDYGIGKGGNIIDFAILLNDCTIAEWLQSLPGDFSSQKPLIQILPDIAATSSIQVLGDFMISSVALLRYLEQRRIPFATADMFCRELRYVLNGKVQYAIGFKNDSGGYELRNPFFKGSSTPKAITTIRKDAEKLAVFEGFFDFLSFLVLFGQTPMQEWDYCILNSLSFAAMAAGFFHSYKSVHLFLDNDGAGQKCTRQLMGKVSICRDESPLYRHHKDLSEWLVAFGKPPP